MSDDVIIGHDGKLRCAWARACGTASGRYHDEVWGEDLRRAGVVRGAYPGCVPGRAQLVGRVRQAGRISQATVENARAMRSARPRLAVLAQSYASTRKRAPRSVADLPTSTAHAEKFAKQLRSQGYRFVGPTSVYAFMQNIGVVNDHIHGCFRATYYTESQTT